MKVYCIASAKGGSGKTLLTATFGSLLASLGKRVLILDADAATNGLTLLYLDTVIRNREPTRRRGVFETSSAPLGVLLLNPKGLSLLPATYTMAQTDTYELEFFKRNLRDALTGASASRYDFVIIDAQAGVDTYAHEAMLMAEQTIIVTEYDAISVKGVDRLRRMFPNELSFEKHWVLFNKLLPEFAKSFSEFLGLARYLPPIPWDQDVVRAYATGELALDMDRGNPHTLAIMRTAGELFGPDVQGAITEWRKSKTELLRKPYREQLDEIDRVIIAYENEYVDREFSLRSLQERRQLFRGLAFLLAGASAAVAATAALWGSDKSSIVTLSLLAGAMLLGVLLLTVRLLQQTRTLRRQVELEAETDRLRQRIRELQDARLQLQELVDSDVELLTQRTT